jgi:hypothetical protein
LPTLNFPNYQARHPRTEEVVQTLRSSGAYERIDEWLVELIKRIVEPFQGDDEDGADESPPDRRNWDSDDWMLAYSEYHTAGREMEPVDEFLEQITATVREAYEAIVGSAPIAGDAVVHTLLAERGMLVARVSAVRDSFLHRAFKALQWLDERCRDKPKGEPSDWVGALEQQFSEDGPGHSGMPPYQPTLDGFIIASIDCVLDAYDVTVREHPSAAGARRRVE